MVRRALERVSLGKTDGYVNEMKEKYSPSIQSIVDEQEPKINKYFSNMVSLHELDDSFNYPPISRVSSCNNHDDSLKEGTKDWANRSYSSHNESKNDSFMSLKRRGSQQTKDHLVVNNTSFNQGNDKENSYSSKFRAKKKRNTNMDMPLKSGSNNNSQENCQFSKFLINEL